MAYEGIGFVNDNPPAINATNLNKMDNELVYLDKNINKWTRLDGVTVASGDILPLSIEDGDGGYYYNAQTGQITRLGASTYLDTYRYKIIPVEANTYYCPNHNVRWWITVNNNNVMTSYGEQSSSSGSPILTGANSAMIYVTYQKTYSDMVLVKGKTIPADTTTKYMLPEIVEMPVVNEINGNYIKKNGQREVDTKNIYGMVETSGNTISPYNDFSNNLLYLEGKYPYKDQSGQVIFGKNASYNTYLLEVDGVSRYNFTFCRFAVVTLEDKLTVVGNTLERVTEINSTGGAYIFFAFNPSEYLPSEYEIFKQLKNYNIPQNWVLPESIIESKDIYGMIETSGKSKSPYNEFSTDLLYLEGKYPNVSNGHVVFNTNANYNTYLVKVDGVSEYFFTFCRFAVVTLDDKSTVVGNLLPNVNLIDSTGGAYIFFAFDSRDYPTSTYQINLMLQNYNIPPNWILPESQTDVGQKIYGKGYATVKGNLASGNSFTIYENNIKKNNVYSFIGHITSFGSILIGHGKNTYDGSWIEINDTKIILHSYRTSDNVTEYTHGLTIADYIYVQIIVGIEKAKIILFSNQDSYEIAEAFWTGDGGGVAFAESSGSALTDCVFTWSSRDFRKSVWMFGDSYFGMTSNSRWVYYMVQAEYSDNVLLNAFPGEGTGKAITALDNLIQYFGKPKFLVWCLGMNDGSDTDINTPSTNWMNGVNHVLDICETYGITPIFATIPTVPTIYHEGKDKWVRESGYRYIDFAKAVGAQSDGTWYASMLSGDGVHPGPVGAIALYNQAIADCPEITYESP